MTLKIFSRYFWTFLIVFVLILDQVAMNVQATIDRFLLDWELRYHSPATLHLHRSNLGVFAWWLAEEERGNTVEDVTIVHLCR